MDSISDFKKELDATKAQLDHLVKWCSHRLHYRPEDELPQEPKPAKPAKEKKVK